MTSMVKVTAMEFDDAGRSHCAKLTVGQWTLAALAAHSQVSPAELLLDAVDRSGHARERDRRAMRQVMDIQTGQGAWFDVRKGRDAAADLAQQQICVCPLFQPALVWLYEHPADDISTLPRRVTLAGTASPIGYRRPGAGLEVIESFRSRIAQALAAAPNLPVTEAQLHLFMQRVLGEEEWALLSAYLRSLTAMDAARWTASLMAASGCYGLLPGGGGRMVMVARRETQSSPPIGGRSL